MVMTDKVLDLLAQEECGEFSLSLPPHSWAHFLPTLMDSEPLDSVLMVLSLTLSLWNLMYHWPCKISWIWIVISMKVPLLIWQRELMEVRARSPCPYFSLSYYVESKVCHIIFNISLMLFLFLWWLFFLSLILLPFRSFWWPNEMARNE